MLQSQPLLISAVAGIFTRNPHAGRKMPSSNNNAIPPQFTQSVLHSINRNVKFTFKIYIIITYNIEQNKKRGGDLPTFTYVNASSANFNGSNAVSTASSAVRPHYVSAVAGVFTRNPRAEHTIPSSLQPILRPP